ncbi:TolC family protein [Dokdonella ginsengisoli]|uniref:TolC family protein n=1 Tax=Dokdonella ginsengisoli TaxID=363846 RepID=A0ABV9QYK9_9GAMM
MSAACARYEPRPIDPATTAQAFAARRLDAPELREAVRDVAPQLAANWPPPSWSRADLLAAALVQNSKLALARAQTQAAWARQVGAGATPNPDLNLQSEYARDETRPWLYGIAFDFALRTPSRRRLDIDVARLATTSARWQLVEQTWGVRRALVDALGEGELARRRVETLDRLLQLQRQWLSAQQRRVELGAEAPGTLANLRMAVLELEQQRAEAGRDAAGAQAALAAVLGLPAQALDDVQVDWSDWGTPPEAAAAGEAGERALLARADLAAAIADYAGAEKQLERAVARQYPQFHLRPGYYWDHGIAKWPLDVGFELPLFQRNEGEIADARAAREVAGQRLLAVQAGIQGEIEAARRADAAAVTNVNAAQRRLDEARRQAQHAEFGLGLGAIDRAERLGAQTLAVRAELDLLQARAQAQLARNALEDALREPLSGPELALQSALHRDAPATNSASTDGDRP